MVLSDIHIVHVTRIFMKLCHVAASIIQTYTHSAFAFSGFHEI